MFGAATALIVIHPQVVMRAAPNATLTNAGVILHLTRTP
jgi:hypothetical protein